MVLKGLIAEPAQLRASRVVLAGGWCAGRLHATTPQTGSRGA